MGLYVPTGGILRKDVSEEILMFQKTRTEDKNLLGEDTAGSWNYRFGEKSQLEKMFQEFLASNIGLVDVDQENTDLKEHLHLRNEKNKQKTGKD